MTGRAAKLGLMGALMVAGGLVACQRAAMEPPSTAPAPEQEPGHEEGRVEDVSRATPPPIRGLPGSLEPPHVELARLDPILNAAVGRDAVLRERTGFWRDFWTSRSRDHFERYLERMGTYQDLVDAELEFRELPSSLRYLPLVESGYHHGVSSRAGATGLWQLMPATARGLGLTVDGIVDDRRDPVAATRAALDYLAQLHDSLGSWFLALAAYNAGPGRVGRLLARYAPDPSIPGDERYLRIRSRLPAETREFVPRFFAVSQLAAEPERYGFRPVDPSSPLTFDEATVPDATSFDVIARAAGVEEEEIERLNPQYTRRFTPAGVERVVRLPEGTGATFEERYALIPPEERVSFLEHVVASGETLTHIARRYGVRVGDLQGANGSLDPRRLQIGQRIVVPVAGRASGSGTTTVASASSSASAGTSSNGRGAAPGGGGTGDARREHVVARGESLWTISRRHGVGMADLREWNGLDQAAVLQPGQELVVMGGDRPATHRVRRGESWWAIARMYGISSAELARANGRTTSDVVRVGEELRIP